MASQPADLPPKRYVALDSLRGICACMVVLLHFETNGYISALPAVRHGFLFVDFFFVLSGFVIGSSYGSRLADGFPIRRFMSLRLGRIYPLHLVVLIAFLIFEIGFALLAPTSASRVPFTDSFSPAMLVCSLLLVQIFFGPDGTPWNGPSWSISVELWTYLIFALAIRFLGRWIVWLCLATAICAPIILAQLTDRYLSVFHDGALIRCLFGFSLGVLGWRASQWVRHLSLGAIGDNIAEVGIVAVTVGFVSISGADPLSLAGPFVFFLAVMIFSRERGITSKALMLRPFVYVGTLSYSIYMIHGFVMYRLVNVLSKLGWTKFEDGHQRLALPGIQSDIVTLFMLAGVILLAHFTHRWIELPGQRWTKMALSNGRRRPAVLVR